MNAISLRRAVLVVLLGAAAFLLADAIESRYWGWFAGGLQVSPWFLNAGRAAALTSVGVFAAGLLAGATVRRTVDKAVLGGCVAAGSCAAMTAVLFARGPGSIFPLVLLVGAAVLLPCAAAGASASLLLRRH
jgi:hypothetical protein